MNAPFKRKTLVVCHFVVGKVLFEVLTPFSTTLHTHISIIYFPSSKRFFWEIVHTLLSHLHSFATFSESVLEFYTHCHIFSAITKATVFFRDFLYSRVNLSCSQCELHIHISHLISFTMNRLGFFVVVAEVAIFVIRICVSPFF